MKTLKQSIEKKSIMEFDTLKVVLSGVFVFSLLVLMLSVGEKGLKKSEINQETVWNNGICSECGGNWVYKEDHSVVAGCLHVYECDTCHRTAEFSKMY